MIHLLEIIWPDVDFQEGENAVHCPFHDDDRQSAHVKLEDGAVLFHCKTCDEGFNHIQLAERYFKTDRKDAVKLINALTNSLDIDSWIQKEIDLSVNKNVLEMAEGFGIEYKTLKDLNAGTYGDGISYPVTINNRIVDIRTYTPYREPKVRSVPKAYAGYVIPEMVFQEGRIILTEGEKDMAVLRTFGLPAASVTGGAMSVPNKTPIYFQNKKVTIFYDNDKAGKEGALKVANYLLENTELNVSVKIADVSLLIDKEKADVTDYVVSELKKGTDRVQIRTNIINVLNKAKPVELMDTVISGTKKVKEKKVKLAEADKFIGDLLESRVQISASYDSSYTFPQTCSMTHTLTDDSSYTSIWKYEGHKNIEQAIKVIEEGKDLVLSNFTVGAKVPPDTDKKDIKFFNIVMSKKRIPVYKVLVSSTTEDTLGSDKTPTEHSAYVVGRSLEAGKEYRIHYKVIPNTRQNNKSLVLIYDTDDLESESNNLKMTDDVKESLDIINNLSFEELIEHTKGEINANFNDKMIKGFELAVNSVQRFNFGRFKDIKGSIDTIMITDTGFGKSVTSQAIINMYGQGARASLAGTAATPTGLIGGSKAVGTSGSFITTPGLIPRMNNKFVIMEELAKSSGTIMKDLTDIRTSGKAEITRVAGKISLPANVRLAFLTNPKAGKDGQNKSVDSYPNGIEVAQDLLGAYEDIGRFEFIITLGMRENYVEDPTWIPKKPLPHKVVRDRLKWVWTRKPDQIIYEDGVVEYIAVEKTKELNEKFESDVQIFGRKTWMKLAKISIAMAGFMGSHSEDYESIVVKKKHVDEVVKYLYDIYDNPTFKLAEYVKEERSYTVEDNGSVDVLKRLYNNYNQIITQLGLVSEIQTRELQTVSALDSQAFNQILSEMVKFRLVRNIKGKILPTVKFRKILDDIKKEPAGNFPTTVEEEALING